MTLISRINRQFIHLNANCMNSTPCSSKWAASGAIVGQLCLCWLPCETDFFAGSDESGSVSTYRLYVSPAPTCASLAVECPAVEKYSCPVSHPAVSRDTRTCRPLWLQVHLAVNVQHQTAPDSHLLISHASSRGAARTYKKTLDIPI